MQPLHVREGAAGDFDAIWAINAAGQPGVSPFTRDELARLLDEPGHVWVVDAEDADVASAAGYCVTYRSSEAYDGEEFAWFKARYPAFLYIDQLAVAGTHRRAGLGARLSAAMAFVARDWSLPAITCEVNRVPPNPTSLAFHMRMGFAEVGALATSDGRTVALLVKALAS